VDPLVLGVNGAESKEREQIKRKRTAIDSLANNPPPPPCFPCCLWCPNLLAYLNSELS